MRALTGLISGTLFGAGLAVSGMSDPHRVRAFLDLFGAWDPTLAFVMGGAIVPMTLAWFFQKRMAKPLFGDAFNLPETRTLDGQLALGAVLFGIGWGIAGLCPGPAIADLALAPLTALIFAAAMLVGMVAHRITTKQNKDA
jgi:uncharacterized membrane protein YedE/YeeE